MPWWKDIAEERSYLTVATKLMGWVPKTRYDLEKSLSLIRPSLLNAQSAMSCENSQKEAAFQLGTFPIPLLRRLLYCLRLFLSFKC